MIGSGEQTLKLAIVNRVIPILSAVLLLIVAAIYLWPEKHASIKQEISAQKTNASTSCAPPSCVIITLEPGVWHDLREEGLLLPNQHLKWSAFGCIEIIYNDENPIVVCDDGVEPDIEPSPGAITANGEFYHHEGTANHVKIRSLMNEENVLVLTPS